MNQDELKALVGRAALDYVPEGAIVGVGTGSTVELLHRCAGHASRAACAARCRVRWRSTARLQAHGIRVFEPHEVERLPVYIDGADEIDASGCMIKGGGAALTREKIVADLAERFVCIADDSKLVDGARALPVAGRGDPDGGGPDHAPLCGASAARQGCATGVVTDNGQQILDVIGPVDRRSGWRCEAEINQWPGVRHASASLRATARASACSARPRACRRSASDDSEL